MLFRSKSMIRNILFLILMLFALIYTTLNLYYGAERPLSWDEVDYANAANLGISGNALEKGSINLFSFVKLGVAKAKGDSVGIKTIQKNFPDENSDPFYLRHFHPPLPVYYWTFFTANSIENQGRQLIISMTILSITFPLLMLLSIYIISSIRKLNIGIIVIIISIFITSNLFISSFSALNFHAFHLIACILFIACLIRFIKFPIRNNAFILGCSMTGLCLTLESYLFVILGALVSIIILKFYVVFTPKRFLQIVSSHLLSTIVLWPGILSTGGPIKTWLMYFYRIFAANMEEYKNITLSNSWINIVKTNPLVLTVIAISLTLFFIERKKVQRYVLIPFITGFVYLIFMMPFVLDPSYVLPGFGLLIFGSTLILTNINIAANHVVKLNYIIFTSIFLIFIFKFCTVSFSQTKNSITGQVKSFKEVLNFVDSFTAFDRPIFADGGHIFKYYLNSNKIINLYMYSQSSPGFYERINYEYINTIDKIKNREYSLIILNKSRKYGSASFEEIIKSGYIRKNFTNYIVFFDQ